MTDALRPPQRRQALLYTKVSSMGMVSYRLRIILYSQYSRSRT